MCMWKGDSGRWLSMTQNLEAIKGKMEKTCYVKSNFCMKRTKNFKD